MRLSIILFIALITSCTHIDKKIVIIAKGNGGDKNGGLLIKQYLEKKKIDQVELIDSIENKFSDKIHYLIIGQGAALDLINKNYNIKSPVFIYSHILSKDIISFAKEHDNITLLTTKSEADYVKDNVRIIALPLAIPTYLKSDSISLYEQNKPQIDKIIKYPVIHMGGSYKDRNGKDILITDREFFSVKKKLKIPQNQNISVIIHPRTFKDTLSNISLIKNRLISISGKNGIKNTYFFVNNELYDVISSNYEYFSEFIIEKSPPYNGILYAINELNKCNLQYVSVDQYNAFADIKHHVNGFLLNEKDKDQMLYLKYYNQLSLDSDILKEFLKVAK